MLLFIKYVEFCIESHKDINSHWYDLMEIFIKNNKTENLDNVV